MLYSKHNSYPDFIVQDNNNINHIFEVKSFNNSEKLSINSNEYKEKIVELSKMFKVASTVTKQIFYLSIMYEDKWKILQYNEGIEKIFTIEEFKNYFKAIV